MPDLACPLQIPGQHSNDQTVTHFLACLLLGALDIELFIQNRATSAGLIYPTWPSSFMITATSSTARNQQLHLCFKSNSNGEKKNRFSKPQMSLPTTEQWGKIKEGPCWKVLYQIFSLCTMIFQQYVWETLEYKIFSGLLGCHWNFRAAWAVGWWGAFLLMDSSTQKTLSTKN